MAPLKGDDSTVTGVELILATAAGGSQQRTSAGQIPQAKLSIPTAAAQQPAGTTKTNADDAIGMSFQFGHALAGQRIPEDDAAIFAPHRKIDPVGAPGEAEDVRGIDKSSEKRTVAEF